MAGKLQSLTPQKLVVATDDGPREFQLPELRNVQFSDAKTAEPEEPVIEVQLRDGSLLRSSRFTVTGAAAIEFAGIAVETPVKSLSWVLMQSLDKDDQAKKDWLKLLSKEAAADRIAYARKTADGQLVLENLAGTILDVTAERVQFELDGDRLEPSRSKVIGLIYLPARDRLKEKLVGVRLIDGTLLAAADVELKEETLHVATGAGLEVDVPLDKVAGLELGATNITYLSDLKPTSVECEPYFGVVLESERRGHLPRMDEDHHGDPLKVTGRPVASKGLAIRSHTTMVYRLDRPYKRMLATIGIAEHVLDSEVTPHLKLVITSGDKELFSREITGTDEPFELELDLADVQRLTIDVQYGNSQDIADYLHLCNARLLK